MAIFRIVVLTAFGLTAVPAGLCSSLTFCGT
jgi:hypothetical protein